MKYGIPYVQSMVQEYERSARAPEVGQMTLTQPASNRRLVGLRIDSSFERRSTCQRLTSSPLHFGLQI